MNQKVNELYKELFTNNPQVRYILVDGGRGRGGSTAASQYANAKLFSDDYFRCAIMRYILGDIRNSIYREIYDRLEENEKLDETQLNETLMSFEHGSNSINAVGFRKSSGGQKAKLKSLASYNCIIIEEAEEIPEEDFMQLDDSLRTIKGDIKVILVLNPPPKNHWINKRWFNLIPSEQQGFYDFVLKPEIKDTILIKGTYKDNIKNIAPQTVIRYESYRDTKPSHYWNMVRGLVPETVVGKIFNNWIQIDEIPHEARLENRGQDYGYSVDPSVIIDKYYYNGGYILDERLYQKGMSNKSLADFKLALEAPQTLTIADSAEPKSIDEEKSYGVNIIGATKGQGSVNQGIQFVQNQKISVTRRSTNLWKAYENYAWTIDKDGNIINVPNDTNHEWSNAMDTVRYCFNGQIMADNSEEDLPDDTSKFSGGFY